MLPSEGPEAGDCSPLRCLVPARPLSLALLSVVVTGQSGGRGLLATAVSCACSSLYIA